MDDKQYEAYVSDVVRGLSISKNAKIFRNRRYEGVRQPGRYEIDIACEIFVDDALFFLIIVECKNWKIPVDRPQIQKLIQTRDAVSAHKAAFASPIGYTKEAIEVAKANGVALWQIAKGVFVTYAGGGGLAASSLAQRVSKTLRQYIYELVDYTGEYSQNIVPVSYGYGPDEFRAQFLQTRGNLVPFEWTDVAHHFPQISPFLRVDDPAYVAAITGASSQDPIMTELVEYLLSHLETRSSVTDKLSQRLSEYRSVLVQAGLDNTQAEAFLAGSIGLMVNSSSQHFGSWENISALDKSIKHSGTEMVAPLNWLEKHGQSFFIYTSPGAIPQVQLSNNIVWANAAWLLTQARLLDSSL